MASGPLHGRAVLRCPGGGEYQHSHRSGGDVGADGLRTGGVPDQGVKHMRSILIKDTTREEREEYIRTKFRCISNCDMCGLCTVLHGKSPETAYADYIEGRREYIEVSRDLR